GARGRQCARGAAERPARRRHASSLSTQKAVGCETRRGGCSGRCGGAGRSKRVGGHTACAAAAHGERVGGGDPSGGERSRGRLASLHETRACKSEMQGGRDSSSGGAEWAGPLSAWRTARADSVRASGGPAPRMARGVGG